MMMMRKREDAVSIFSSFFRRKILAVVFFFCHGESQYDSDLFSKQSDDVTHGDGDEGSWISTCDRSNYNLNWDMIKCIKY